MAVMISFSSPHSAKYCILLYFTYCPEERKGLNSVFGPEHDISPFRNLSKLGKCSSHFSEKMHTDSSPVMEKVNVGEVVRDSGMNPPTHPPMWPWRTACLMDCGCVYWEQEALSMHVPSRTLVLRDESLLLSLCHNPASAWHLPGTQATRQVRGPTGLTG